jgi:hypothetical protein
MYRLTRIATVSLGWHTEGMLARDKEGSKQAKKQLITYRQLKSEKSYGLFI